MNYATNICINGFINWNKLHGINLIVVGQASKDWNIFGPNCPGLVVVGYVFRVCPRENHTGKSSRNGQCSSIFHTKLFKWPGDITDKWAMDSSVFQVYPCLSLCKVVCFSRGNVAKSQRGQPWGLNSGPRHVASHSFPDPWIVLLIWKNDDWFSDWFVVVKLVGGDWNMAGLVSHILMGMSSSQLTDSLHHFSEG